MIGRREETRGRPGVTNNQEELTAAVGIPDAVFKIGEPII